MAKTDETVRLEREIWGATRKQGVFGCFEVTIGWFGKERVDYLTYDTKGIWRCYEIKVSKSDFHSKSSNTFVGHFNYYVMPKELFELVADEIPEHIGVYVSGEWPSSSLVSAKRAKRKELAIDEQVLKNSLIRSLHREAEKIIKSDNPTVVESLSRQLQIAKSEVEKYRQKYWNLRRMETQ